MNRNSSNRSRTNNLLRISISILEMTLSIVELPLAMNNWDGFSSFTVVFIYSTYDEILKYNREKLRPEGPGAVVIRPGPKIAWLSARDIKYELSNNYAERISFQKYEDKYAYIIISGYGKSSLYKLSENGDLTME